MYSPKEARADRYIISMAIALIAALGALFVINISFYNGLRYGLVQLDRSEAVGRVTGIRNQGSSNNYEIDFTFQDRRGRTHAGTLYASSVRTGAVVGGQTVIVLYNRFVPRYFMYPSDLDDYRADFFVTLACALVIVLSIFVFFRQQLKYRQFRERMKYY